MKEQWNDWEGVWLAGQVEGLAEGGRQRPSAFAGERKACKKGEESTDNEKNFFCQSSLQSDCWVPTQGEDWKEKKGNPPGKSPSWQKPRWVCGKGLQLSWGDGVGTSLPEPWETSLAPSSASAQSQPRSTSQGCQSRFFYYSNNKIEDTSEENTYP